MKRLLMALALMTGMATAAEPTGTTSVTVLYDYTNGVMWGRSGTSSNSVLYILAQNTNWFTQAQAEALFDALGSAAAASNGVIAQLVSSNWISHASGTALYGSSNGQWTAIVIPPGDVTAAGDNVFSGNNTFAGGTTQAVDGLTATNITMRGNIALGSGWMSGDGGNEGVSVDASGNVLVSGSYLSVRKSGDNSNVDIRAASDTTTHRTYSNFYRSRGSLSSPALVQNNDPIGKMNFYGYDGYGWQGSASRGIVVSGVASSNNVPLSYFWATGTTSANSERMRITHLGDVRLYNMTVAPATGSGYGVIAATNGEVCAWDSGGTKVQLTNDDENKRPTMREENVFSGNGYKIDYLNLVDAVEELLPKEHPLKGKILERYKIPVEDWRANEARQAEERAAEIAAWEQADAQYKAELAKWQAIPMADKARLTQPTKEDDRPKPEPYAVRPIPTWAAEAQRKFNAKWGAVEK